MQWRLSLSLCNRIKVRSTLHPSNALPSRRARHRVGCEDREAHSTHGGLANEDEATSLFSWRALVKNY
jgi:hypothetical protein